MAFAESTTKSGTKEITEPTLDVVLDRLREFRSTAYASGAVLGKSPSDALFSKQSDEEEWTELPLRLGQ